MSIKQDLRDMTTSLEVVTYYNTYIANIDRKRIKELNKIISDAEKELRSLEKNINHEGEKLILERIGQLVVDAA